MTVSTLRRKPHELRMLYELHPEVRDVVVEGREDARWLKWALTEELPRGVNIYAVDDRVEVGETVRVEHGISDNGPRARLLAFAGEFASWCIEWPALTCLLDGDWYYNKPEEYPSCVVLTDYSSREMLAWADAPLSKFLALVAKHDEDPGTVRSRLLLPLRTMYGLRFLIYREQLGLNLSKRAYRSALAVNEVQNINQDWIAGAVREQTQGDEGSRLARELRELLNSAPDNQYEMIRGHDIAPMLIAHLKLTNHHANEPVVEQLLMQGVERRDAAASRMCVSIIVRVSSHL